MMNDLISRQAAIDALEQIFDRCEEIEAHLPEGDPDRTGYKMYPDYMTVWKYLHQLPSAQPDVARDIATIIENEKDMRVILAQPEIIRCKDCKHYDGRPCGIVDWYNTADDFCSKGERRTDG